MSGETQRQDDASEGDGRAWTPPPPHETPETLGDRYSSNLSQRPTPLAALDDLDAEDRAGFEELAERLKVAREDPKNVFNTRPQCRGYSFVEIALRIRNALATKEAPRERLRFLAHDVDAWVLDAMTAQRVEWRPAGDSPAQTVALGADDFLPLKSNVWAYVLCGGRVDIAEIVEELETSGELQKADDADLTRYTTHLLVASKASHQLEEWGLLTPPRLSDGSFPLSVSHSLRQSVERVLDLSLTTTSGRPTSSTVRGAAGGFWRSVSAPVEAVASLEADLDALRRDVASLRPHQQASRPTWLLFAAAGVALAAWILTPPDDPYAAALTS